LLFMETRIYLTSNWGNVHITSIFII